MNEIQIEGVKATINCPLEKFNKNELREKGIKEIFFQKRYTRENAELYNNILNNLYAGLEVLMLEEAPSTLHNLPLTLIVLGIKNGRGEDLSHLPVRLEKLEVECAKNSQDFSYLVNLNSLKIKSAVPCYLFPRRLKCLELSYCNISELKEGLFPPGLQKLCLAGNYISGLKEDLFPPGLQVLNLAVNQISELKEGFFPPGLKVLNLGWNMISELKEGLFPPGLQVLYLDYNYISELKEGLFPSGLQVLNLGNNKISELRKGLFPLGLQVFFGKYKN